MPEIDDVLSSISEKLDKFTNGHDGRLSALEREVRELSVTLRNELHKYQNDLTSHNHTLSEHRRIFFGKNGSAQDPGVLTRIDRLERHIVSRPSASSGESIGSGLINSGLLYVLSAYCRLILWPLALGIMTLLGIKVAKADVPTQYRGISCYACLSPKVNIPDASGQSFCDRYLAAESYAKQPAMSVLWGTFGNDWTCAKRFTDKFTDRPHFVEVILSNEACRRNHRCFEGELLPQYDVSEYNDALEHLGEGPHANDQYAIINRVLEIRGFAATVRGPNSSFALSSGLEDNFTELAFKVLGRVLGQIWPYSLVRNPVNIRRHFKQNAELIEDHSPSANYGRYASCLIAEDGVTRPSASKTRALMRRNRSCLGFFVWRPEHQGVGGRTFVRPLDRWFTFRPKDVRSLGVLLR